MTDNAKKSPAHEILDALFRLNYALHRASQAPVGPLAIVVDQAQFFGIEAALTTAPPEITGGIDTRNLRQSVTGPPGPTMQAVAIDRSETLRLDGTVYLKMEVLGITILTPDRGGDLWVRGFGGRP